MKIDIGITLETWETGSDHKEVKKKKGGSCDCVIETLPLLMCVT